MQRHSPAGNMVDHGQPSPERQHTSNSRDLELGHQGTPANSRWRFGSHVSNVESIELSPLIAEDTQLKNALVKLFKLCKDQGTADNDSLMAMTSGIISSLSSLIIANDEPETPQRARINRILNDTGNINGFLNCFESFSKHVIIQNLHAGEFDSLELRWALFQIYWLLRHLAQHPPNPRLLAAEARNRSCKLPRYSILIPYFSLTSFRLSVAKGSTNGLELSLHVGLDPFVFLWRRRILCACMVVHA